MDLPHNNDDKKYLYFMISFTWK